MNNLDIKCNIQKQRLLQSEAESQPQNQQQGHSDDRHHSSSKHHVDRDNQHKSSVKRQRSIKERRNDHKLENIRIFDPPMIMTTAATPTDSPNNTLEMGASLRDWERSEESIDRSSVSPKPWCLKIIFFMIFVSSQCLDDPPRFPANSPISILLSENLGRSNVI
jgi:hypothetical protein